MKCSFNNERDFVLFFVRISMGCYFYCLYGQLWFVYFYWEDVSYL